MSTTLNSGIDPASFSAVTGPAQDLFRYVNGPWIDMYRLPDDRSRYGSFDKLAEDAENQIREILEDDDCPAEKSTPCMQASLMSIPSTLPGSPPSSASLRPLMPLPAKPNSPALWAR